MNAKQKSANSKKATRNENKERVAMRKMSAKKIKMMCV